MESFCEKYKLPIWAAAAAVLLGLPLLGLSQYLIRIFIMIGIYSMLALGLNLLTGYTGQVSLGHAGFFAIGAYVSSLMSINLGCSFIISFIAVSYTHLQNKASRAAAVYLGLFESRGIPNSSQTA